MRVWITSYALTKGILEMDGEVSERYPEHLRVVGHITSFIKPDWHETEEAAIARADDMRVKRVESLSKANKRS